MKVKVKPKSEFNYKCAILSLILILIVNSKTVGAKGGGGRGGGGRSSGYSSSRGSSHSLSHSSGHSYGHGSSHSTYHSSGHTPSHYSPSHSSGTNYGWSHPSSSTHGSDHGTYHSSFHTSSHNSPPHSSPTWDSVHGWSHPPGHTSHTPYLNRNIQRNNHGGFSSSGSHDVNYYPPVPADGTYHPRGYTLPPDSVYFAQRPVFPSKPNFETGLALGALSQSTHSAFTQPPRHYWSSSSSSSNNNIGGADSLYAGDQSSPLILPDPVPIPAENANTSGALYGIICVPVHVTTTDPNNSTKTIDEEQTACYPAPAPPPVDEEFELKIQRINLLKSSICFESDSEDVVLRVICKQLSDCIETNQCDEMLIPVP